MPIYIVSQASEPLATGVQTMRALLQPFERLRKRGLVKHTLQTNGTLTEAFYRGHLDTPKTEASIREVALDSTALQLLREWKAKSPRTAPEDLVFGTRSGQPDRPENLLNRHVFPACDALKIPRATFLTFRRTFSTLSHYNGVPAKDIAESMGHAEVDTQFIYIQTVGEAKRTAAKKLGLQLVTNGHSSDETVD